MAGVIVKDLNIIKVANSGMTFRMRNLGNQTYSVVTQDRYLEAHQLDDDTCELMCTTEEYDEFWASYFDMDHDYQRFREAIDPADTFLKEAAEYGRGVRILRQDLWEVMCSFVVSQNNNIARISRSLTQMCEELGQTHTTANGIEYHSFPEPRTLTDEGLVKLYRIGYRTPYITSLARDVVNGNLDLEALKKSDDPAFVRRQLLAQNGVGAKVAACIELFGLHMLSSYPIDTWLKRVIENRYNGTFDWDRYEGFQGVVQQWLFIYERHLARTAELGRVPSASKSN
jgi:N-glycosylase/DNA lyase